MSDQPNQPSSDKQIAAALLDWYVDYCRDLPWRATDDSYRIWVSEIMLQQTQVDTVIPYYERFLSRFPTIQALADADLDGVLALWQGLGYYSRARNLHRAARILAHDGRDRLPAEKAALLKLPGIGEYTAGAILSIAYNQDAVAVDGNVKRILARVMNYTDDIDRAAGKRAITQYARALLPPGQARDFNQALMDLGSMICLPRSPRCGVCPLAAYCQARALGVQEQRPVKSPRPATPTYEMVAAYIEQSDGRWLLVRRRPQGLLGGLWELPAFRLSEETANAPAEALDAALSRHLGLKIQTATPLITVAHAYSHFRINVTVYACDISGEPELADHETWDAIHWLAQEHAQTYGLTGITVKILQQIHGPQLRLL